MKKLFLYLLLTLISVAAVAQDKTKPVNTYKFSGYVMSRYNYTSQDVTPDNGFSIRIARLMLDGRILGDFNYRLQLQVNGTSNNINGPRIVDAYVEWQKYSFFKVKLGEFKRAFTFENPMSPVDQGFYANGTVIQKLSGFDDRVGEHSCNGRDIGVQVQGDFLKNANGRNLLHYMVGVYNGQGINVNDVNSKKDLIGGVWVMPIAGLRIGAFGWNGTYARKGVATGSTTTEIREVKRQRYALSAEYKADDWTVRSEYIHSHGLAFNSTTTTDLELSSSLGEKADGWYALMIAPVKKDVFHVKARYNVYRKNATWDSSNNQYELGADYMFAKNLIISGEYIHVNDRSLAKHNYDMLDCQVTFRF